MTYKQYMDAAFELCAYHPSFAALTVYTQKGNRIVITKNEDPPGSFICMELGSAYSDIWPLLDDLWSYIINGNDTVRGVVCE